MSMKLGGLIEMVRNQARSDVLRAVVKEEEGNKLHEKIKNLPDEALDLMGAVSGIPEYELPVYRAMVKGEENEFRTKMSEFAGVLQTGDIILVTGAHWRSKALVAAQRPFYIRARASHVALVHADFVCIDSMPGTGVSNRSIAAVLNNVEDNWRIIRFNAVSNDHRDEMLTRCAYYLQQPYKIKPQKGAGKQFSYCSELARKVYQDCKVKGTKIPKGVLINPCHFDQIADKGEVCQDITETVRPFLGFLKEYEAMLNVTSGLFVKGLQLNRHRFKERTNFLKDIEGLASRGVMPKESMERMVNEIKLLEDKMNFKFWDFTRESKS